MNTTLFAIFSIAFVCIRAHYHQPEDPELQEVRSKREKVLAGQFSLALLLTHGWWLSQWQTASLSAVAIVGAIVMGLSLPLLIWVHHSLGVYFSARLVLKQDHVIIQQGPYKWVRHPMYTVGFLYLIGAGLLSESWIVGLLPTCSFGLLVMLRVHDEERMLCSVSEEYTQYMRKTGRFIPRLLP